MTVAIALFTSPAWPIADRPLDDRRLRRLATATTLVIYLQILVGAVMRHTDAGLAIPDFPWMFGHVVPDHWDARIAVHFAHRVGALIVASFIFSLAAYIWRRHADRPALRRPAAFISVLVLVQITLGALTVLSARDIWINSVHLVSGALVLATSIVITLRSWRTRIVAATEGHSAAVAALARPDVLSAPRRAGHAREERRGSRRLRWTRADWRRAAPTHVADYIALTKPRSTARRAHQRGGLLPGAPRPRRCCRWRRRSAERRSWPAARPCSISFTSATRTR
jgi:hypothetical protein